MKTKHPPLNRIEHRKKQLAEDPNPHQLLVPHLFAKALNEELHTLLTAMTDPLHGHVSNKGGFRVTLNKLCEHLPRSLDEHILPVLPYMPKKVGAGYFPLKDEWKRILDETARRIPANQRKRRTELRIALGYDVMKRMVAFFAEHSDPMRVYPGLVESLKQMLDQLEPTVQQLGERLAVEEPFEQTVATWKP